MKKIIFIAWISLLGLGTTSLTMAGPNQDLGTVIGGIAGGMIGHDLGYGPGKTVATIGGAVVGSLVGNQLGRSVDRTERYYPPHGYRYWDERPYYYHGRYHYHNSFIGRDGRFYRRAIYRDPYGHRIYRTSYCNHRLGNGRCENWVVVRR